MQDSYLTEDRCKRFIPRFNQEIIPRYERSEYLTSIDIMKTSNARQVLFLKLILQLWLQNRK